MAKCPLPLLFATNGWFFMKLKPMLDARCLLSLSLSMSEFMAVTQTQTETETWIYTYRQHWVERNNCELVALISGTHTSQHLVSGPILSAASSRRCPDDVWPETADRRCMCRRPQSGCGCPDAVSRIPASNKTKKQIAHKMSIKCCWESVDNVDTLQIMATTKLTTNRDWIFELNSF